jgi:hypothetical protein
MIGKRIMGTVEPDYKDLDSRLEALAFIKGAIKKYGNNPACAEELRDYIIKMTDYIVRDSEKLLNTKNYGNIA